MEGFIHHSNTLQKIHHDVVSHLLSDALSSSTMSHATRASGDAAPWVRAASTADWTASATLPDVAEVDAAATTTTDDRTPNVGVGGTTKADVVADQSNACRQRESFMILQLSSRGVSQACLQSSQCLWDLSIPRSR